MLTDLQHGRTSVLQPDGSLRHTPLHLDELLPGSLRLGEHGDNGGSGGLCPGAGVQAADTESLAAGCTEMNKVCCYPKEQILGFL